MYSNELICKIIDYINKNIDIEITIDDLSNQFFFNRTYIMKKFKKELNITIFNYINAIKIYNSLTKFNNNKSITSIALTSGFNSIEYFSEIFKKIMKVSPRKYLDYCKYYYKLNEEDLLLIQSSSLELYDIVIRTTKYLSKRPPTKIYKKTLSLFK